MLRRSMLRKGAAITVLAMGLAACGGDDDTTTDPGTTETTDDTGTDGETDGDTAGMHEANGTLELGYILPETGQLAFLGPPQIKGVEYAISLINEAGGVLGNPVTLASGDEAGDAAIASQSASRLLGEGVDAIIGAAASGMSLSFIDQVTGAGVVQCSASNTSPTFTNYSDGGYYFRAAPTDALQGPVLAEAILADGHQNVSILTRSDDYGQGLLKATQDALEAQGATVTAISYDQEAATFSAEVGQATASSPDAIVLISFAEGAQILKELIEAGSGPSDLAVYGADGLRSNTLWEDVDPDDASVLEGMKGTAPAAATGEDFLADLQAFAPELTDLLFAGEAFDCATVIALAAESAGTDAGEAFRQAMIDVTRDGEKCDSFASCKELLDAGTDIDYDGKSGALDFVDAGEPSVGRYEVWEIGNDGQLSSVEFVESTLS